MNGLRVICISLIIVVMSIVVLTSLGMYYASNSTLMHQNINQLIGDAEIRLIFMSRVELYAILFQDYEYFSTDGPSQLSYYTYTINKDKMNFEKTKSAVLSISYDTLLNIDNYMLPSLPEKIYIVFENNSYIIIENSMKISIYSADAKLQKQVYGINMTGRDEALGLLRSYGEYKVYENAPKTLPIDGGGWYTINGTY